MVVSQNKGTFSIVGNYIDGLKLQYSLVKICVSQKLLFSSLVMPRPALVTLSSRSTKNGKIIAIVSSRKQKQLKNFAMPRHALVPLSSLFCHALVTLQKLSNKENCFFISEEIKYKYRQNQKCLVTLSSRSCDTLVTIIDIVLSRKQNQSISFVMPRHAFVTLPFRFCENCTEGIEYKKIT